MMEALDTRNLYQVHVTNHKYIKVQNCATVSVGALSGIVCRLLLNAASKIKIESSNINDMVQLCCLIRNHAAWSMEDWSFRMLDIKLNHTKYKHKIWLIDIRI